MLSSAVMQWLDRSWYKIAALFDKFLAWCCWGAGNVEVNVSNYTGLAYICCVSHGTYRKLEKCLMQK